MDAESNNWNEREGERGRERKRVINSMEWIEREEWKRKIKLHFWHRKKDVGTLILCII